MLKPPARIGVVVVHWNSPELLDDCLQHLDAQHVMPDRIVVVDNASDGFDAGRVERRFPAATVVCNDENLGFAGGANRGAQELHDCDWIAFLNPDAFPDPGWLQALQQAAQTYPHAGSIASHMIQGTTPPQLDGTGDVYHISGRVWRRDEGCRPPDPARALGPVFSACAGAAAYQRDAFREVGGFETGFFCYLEDVDLGFRLRLAGYECVYVPTASVRHLGSAVTGRRSEFSLYHGHRNLVWTFVRNMPSPLFWSLLPYHLLLNLATLTWFVLRGQGRTLWRAKRDAFLALPQVWRERQAIQSQRRITCRAVWACLDKGPPWPRCRNPSPSQTSDTQRL